MAKREIPEINAGSMADIAFLLLIFFLVTTTMDRDQAYVRNIPKKIELTEIVKIEERNILAIRANSLNQLMVRNEMVADPDDISDKIIEFYQKNEKQNDPTNNYPMYTRIGMDFINTQINQIESEISSLESQDAPSEMIDFKYSQVDEWAKKKKSLQLFGGPELPEIHFQANIRIEVQDATEYGLFAKIQTEIEEAIYELRNGQAERIFNESYGTIKKRYATDQDPADKAKLNLLEVLYPARIIEVTPKK